MANDLYLVPNWSQEFSETREFLTEIFVSRSGKEQRRARRNRPRLTIDFGAILNGDSFRAMERSKVAGGEQRIGHFTYPRARLIKPAAAGATEIFVDSLPEYPDFCIHRGLSIEYGTWIGSSTIEAFDEGFDEGFGPSGFRLVLNTPLKFAWNAGASVRPVINGRLTAETSLTMESSTSARLSVRFEPTPGDDIPSVAVTPYSTFNGAELFLLKPDWASRPTAVFLSQFETVDYGVGVRQHYTPIAFSPRTSTFNYSERSHQDIANAVGLFDRMRGMAGEFYCPTWTSDLELAASASVGATALYVKGEEVEEVYAGDTVRKAILLVKKDGTLLPLGLTSIVPAVVAGQSRLNLAAPLAAAVAPSDLRMISWLPLCRFASDLLTVTWITDTAARFTMNIRSVEVP